MPLPFTPSRDSTVMSTLLEKPIKISRILATGTAHVHAIDDPARARIIGILYRRSLSAEQILAELKKTGYKKAITTLRYHLDILRESGLIEVVRIDESRGAITKYYGTSAKMLDFETPEDFDSSYSRVIDRTSARIQKIIDGLRREVAKSDGGGAGGGDGYSQYLVIEIMGRAMANVLENPAGAK